MSPFHVRCSLIIGFVRSEVVRSPKGGAFRAKRRAKPMTVTAHSPQRLVSHASPILGEPPPAMGDSLRVPISFLPSQPQRPSAPWWLAQKRVDSWVQDFLPAQSLSAVLDAVAAVPPLAYQHLALGWRIVATLRLELEKAIVVPHHPVLANDAFALQPEKFAPIPQPVALAGDSPPAWVTPARIAGCVLADTLSGDTRWRAHTVSKCETNMPDYVVSTPDIWVSSCSISSRVFPLVSGTSRCTNKNPAKQIAA